MSKITITPIDGWGFAENVDGQLSPSFEVELDETGIDLGGVVGWRGQVLSPGHKYAGMPFDMTPRHTTWTGTVVINIRDGFSGMADTEGLQCDWL
ncbi:MAG TPA: hypothetical protein VK485_00680 [Sphingomicrobium sp.]|nr:hypothetical protein [Sphingomicrobium sp.]